MSSRGRALLVLYPPGLGYYEDREFLAILPGWETTYAFEDPSLAGRFRSSTPRWRPLRSAPIVPGLPVAPLVNRIVCNLGELLDAVRPEVVVSYDCFSSISDQVSWCGRRKQFRHIVLCYETVGPANSLWGWFPMTREFGRRTCATADLFIAHTARAGAVLEAMGVKAERRVVRSPGVLPPTAPRATDDGVPDGAPARVLYLGSLSRNKGIRTVNRAATTLLTDPRYKGRVRFDVVGDGPLRPETDATATSVGEQFRVHGRVSEEAKMDLFSRASVFVCPSVDVRLGPWIRWEEQTATAAMEAMSYGVPVVGSDSGALPEIIGPAGWVFRQGSGDDLARVLGHLLDHPEERARAGASARSLAAGKYSLTSCAREVAALLTARGAA